VKRFRRPAKYRPGSGPRADAALQRIGVSRREIARILELSESRIYNTLTGRDDLRVTTALAIEAAFGVRAEHILHDRTPIYAASIGLDRISEEAVAMGLAYERLDPDARLAFYVGLRGLGEEGQRLERSV
jgi:transcriptional regulator with XRE-family HTH domain